jgi:hypothetical protein
MLRTFKVAIPLHLLVTHFTYSNRVQINEDRFLSSELSFHERQTQGRKTVRKLDREIYPDIYHVRTRGDGHFDVAHFSLGPRFPRLLHRKMRRIIPLEAQFANIIDPILETARRRRSSGQDDNIVDEDSVLEEAKDLEQDASSSDDSDRDSDFYDAQEQFNQGIQASGEVGVGVEADMEGGGMDEDGDVEPGRDGDESEGTEKESSESDEEDEDDDEDGDEDDDGDDDEEDDDDDLNINILPRSTLKRKWHDNSPDDDAPWNPQTPATRRFGLY